MEYHQAPLVVSAAVTAIPSNAPLSTSLTLSTCPAGEAKSTRAETSVPTAPEGAPESSFWAVKAGLLVLSNTGASLTALTVMVATTVLPPRPASPLAVEAWTVKLPLPLKLAVGVNLSPALPSANVMNVPLLICVVPSFLYSVPLLIPVILKCVTSAPSAALRASTSPLVVCVSSLVVALVTDGVSATGLITRLAVSVAVEKAVVPPLLVVSASVPLVPLVWSQARKVRALARVPL